MEKVFLEWDEEIKVEKPDILENGVYRFVVTDTQKQPYGGSNKIPACDSILVFVNIEGFQIAERFCLIEKMIPKANYFLSCIKAKGLYDNFRANDIMNSIGKKGLCYVNHYTDESGRLKNRIQYFVQPDDDVELVEWRQAVLERAGYKCEICGSTEMVQAHHVLAKKAYPALMYDINNGKCLCKFHHDQAHAGEMKFCGGGL